MSTLTERMAQLPQARRKKVDERVRAVIAGEMSLRDTAPITHSGRDRSGRSRESSGDSRSRRGPRRR